MACLKRGKWMEVMMISRGIEISIAGGGEGMKDVCIIMFESHNIQFLLTA